MAHLTHQQYDDLERAVRNGTRIAVYRRGHEYVVVPRDLRLHGGREAIHAVHPTTGDALTFYIDDLEGLEVVR